MGMIFDPVTLERGLRAEFSIAAQTKRNPLLDALMLRVPSTKSEEKYGWLGQVAGLRQWKDGKVYEATTEHSYTLANVQYEGSIQVRQTDIKDDQVGGITKRINDLTVKGVYHPEKLLLDAIIAGDAAGGEAYDGQYFFDTDHSEGDSGTQSNKLTGTGVTAATVLADFRAARAALMGYKDSKGAPIFESSPDMKYVVVAPVGLYGVFEELQNAAIISNTTNVIKGIFDLVAHPRLTTDDSNDWYLFAYNDMMKPFILQEREPLTFHAQEAESDMGFNNNVYAYSVHWRGAVGYAWWQMAVKTTNT